MLLKGISFHSELKNIHLNINFYYALLASVYYMLQPWSQIPFLGVLYGRSVLGAFFF